MFLSEYIFTFATAEEKVQKGDFKIKNDSAGLKFVKMTKRCLIPQNNERNIY